MKWIPVGVRKPGKNQDVLVTVENLDAVPHLPHFWDRFVSLARYKGEGNFALRDYTVPYNTKVTHWTALPMMPHRGFGNIRLWLIKMLQG